MAEINGLGATSPELSETIDPPRQQEGNTADKYTDAMPLPKPRRANIFTHNIFTRKSFGEIFEQNKRGVFEVRVRDAQNAIGSGTAFIVNQARNNDGTWTYQLFTNAHVVNRTIDLLLAPDEISENTNIELRNTTDPDQPLTFSDVRVMGVDIILDLAVLEITTSENLPVCKMANTPKLRALEDLLVVGNTHGTGISPNMGNVKTTEYGVPVCSYRAFQNDAEVTGGNSGSPVFNHWGEVVGVFFRSSTDGTLRNSFYIDRALASYERILQNPGVDGVAYGDWGITVKEIEAFERNNRFQNLPPQYQDAGIEVLNVVRGSAADNVGIQPGDDILAINGSTNSVKIESELLLYLFYETVRDSHEGENFVLTIHRDGSVFDVSLTAQETLYSPPAVFDTKRGFKVLDFPTGYKEINGISGDVQGVLAVMDNAMDGDDDTNASVPFLNRSIVLGIYIQKEEGQANYFPTPNVKEFKKVYQSIPRGTQFSLAYQATASNFYIGSYHSAGPAGVSYQIFE